MWRTTARDSTPLSSPTPRPSVSSPWQSERSASAGRLILDSQPGQGTRVVVRVLVRVPGLEVPSAASPAGPTHFAEPGASMTKTDRVRILIADDHPVVREGLVALINRQPDLVVVAEASNGREAVEQFLRHRPDVALLDLRMPEMDGVDAIAAIRQKIPTARLIILTTFDEDEDIYQGLRAGAKAYLLKDAPRDDLLKCVRAVHQGQTIIPPRIAAKLADRLTTSELTRREVQVLQLVADGQGQQGDRRRLVHSAKAR